MPTLTRPALAVLGGAPAFERTLHVGRPVVPDRRAFLQRVEEALDRGWLTNNGPLVRELEERIAAYVGVRNAVAVASATAGLQILTRALELTGEVIVPSLTFVATAHALTWQGLRPRFCDVDATTHNLDPAAVERGITPATSAILGVHLWGRPCAVEALERIARRHGLELLFDAAHAFGCSHGARRVGGFGRAEVFSFHATKALQSIEGGAVVTDDDDLARRLRLLRNFGFAGYDRVEDEGINAKLGEIAAAMGLTGLDHFATTVAGNRDLHEAYLAALDGIPGVVALRYDEREENNYQYAVLELDEERAGLARDTLMRVLHAERVLARRYFHPGCHRAAPYRHRDPHAGRHLPVTEALGRRLLCLPTGPQLDPAGARRIGDIVRAAVDQAEALTALEAPVDG